MFKELFKDDPKYNENFLKSVFQYNLSKSLCYLYTQNDQRRTEELGKEKTNQTWALFLWHNSTPIIHVCTYRSNPLSWIYIYKCVFTCRVILLETQDSSFKRYVAGYWTIRSKGNYSNCLLATTERTLKCWLVNAELNIIENKDRQCTRQKSHVDVQSSFTLAQKIFLAYWTPVNSFGGGGTYESIHPHASSDHGDETHWD